MRDVRLLDQPFRPQREIARFADALGDPGALVSFVGAVRADHGVEALELTHYAPLTLRGMEELGKRAGDRFALAGVLIIHRIGRLLPGAPIVCVAAAADHRRAAFEGADFIMDHLKSAAWFWKREQRDGQWRWIEPRAEDYADRARWE